MELVDPVKIFAAASILRAEMICRILQQADIEAFADKNPSPLGIWADNTHLGIYDFPVWVSRTDAERAAAIIREWERQEFERASTQGEDVEVICEECGKTAVFASVHRGTVQNCPHCDAYLDVSEESPEEDPLEEENSTEE